MRMFARQMIPVLLLPIFFSCGNVSSLKKDSDNAQNDGLIGADNNTQQDGVIPNDSDNTVKQDILPSDNDTPAQDTTTLPDTDIVSKTCGDSVIQTGEICDGGVKDCVLIDSQKYAGGKAKCLLNCTGWDTETCEPAQQNECTSGLKQCYNETQYQTCGDYDSDGYTEWGNPVSCGTNKSCTGSGNCVSDCTTHNYYQCYNGNVYWYDSCSIREDQKESCGTSGYTGSKFCQSGDVYQNYVTRGCSSDYCTEQTDAVLMEECASGCTSGSCNAGKAATWTDSGTGLTWQNSSFTTTKAQSAAATYCDSLTLASYSDWRLPTIGELRSLARSCTKITTSGTCGVTDSCKTYGTCYSDANCGTCTTGSGPSDTGLYWDAALDDNSGATLWSNTLLSDYTTYGWYINFSTGSLLYNYATTTYNVRCVRGASAGYCGDGYTTGNEICDGDSTECSAVLGSSYTGTAYCNGYCDGWDTSACAANTINPPATVSASDGSYTGYVYISWSTVSNAEKYYVYRATSASGTYALITSSGVTTAYHYDYPPAASTTYYYKVTAYNSTLGESAKSSYNSGWCY